MAPDPLNGTMKLLGTAAGKALFQSVFRSVRRGRLGVTTTDGKRREYGGTLPGRTIEARVLSNDFYRRMLRGGELALGETYMDGLWDTDDLTGLLVMGIENRQYAPRIIQTVNDIGRIPSRKLHMGRRNSLKGSRRNIHDHYDLSNELFALFLDETLTYSSAVFEDEDQCLADAQRHKYDMLCRKAQFSPSDRALEIGCGWGGFAMHAAEHFGASVVATTISREQYELAEQRIAEAGLTDRIELHLVDYRELDGIYDKIISIEMFEAVGAEYFASFFERCNALLRPGGRLVMQTIAVPERSFDALRNGASWMQRYIFPGGALPSIAAIERAIAGTSLIISHVEDIGAHYVRTLQQWRARFEARRDEVYALGFDDRFIRMWRYYLCAAEAGFETRSTSDLQIVLEKLPA